MQKRQVLEALATNPEILTEILEQVKHDLFLQWGASDSDAERSELYSVTRGLTLVERHFNAAIARIRNP